MTEQQTPVLTPPVQPTAPKGPKKKHKGRGKTIAGIIVAAAVAIALIVLVWYFVFRDTTALGDPTPRRQRMGTGRPGKHSSDTSN